jgi:3-oxosteroid 1-dehydrogenase
VGADWHEETDFISVGSGAGGLTAALVAASRGANALVLEKDALLGGVTARSFGQTWLPANAFATALGLLDSEEEGMEYMRYVGAGFHDESRLAPLLRAGTAAVEFLTTSGALELEVIRDMADYYYPVAPGAKAEGRYLEVVPFAASRLGELRPDVAVSPHGYALMTTRETIAAGGDVAALGAGAAAPVDP